MIAIAHLADFPAAAPILADWFAAQWPEYYADRTQTEIAEDFHLEASYDTIPMRLLAYATGELAGTITLRRRAISSLPDYQPGLGGLFVVERQRGHGIGSRLVQAGTEAAWTQGYENVYTTTSSARGIVERQG